MHEHRAQSKWKSGKVREQDVADYRLYLARLAYLCGRKARELSGERTRAAACGLYLTSLGCYQLSRWAVAAAFGKASAPSWRLAWDYSGGGPAL